MTLKKAEVIKRLESGEAISWSRSWGSRTSYWVGEWPLHETVRRDTVIFLQKAGLLTEREYPQRHFLQRHGELRLRKEKKA